VAVTGIGGLFFRAKDPKALGAWYAQHLGVGTGPYGTWDQQAGTSLFLPVGPDSDDIASDRQWRINFRVDDLDAMLARLRGAGIEVITKPEWDAPGLGRFARLHDPEGNAVELWEPDEG
jgi:predicted enzyme related to lactoylglutathione lyase